MTRKQQYEAFLACAAQSFEIAERESYYTWLSLFQAVWEE